MTLTQKEAAAEDVVQEILFDAPEKDIVDVKKSVEQMILDQEGVKQIHKTWTLVRFI